MTDEQPDGERAPSDPAPDVDRAPRPGRQSPMDDDALFDAAVTPGEHLAKSTDARRQGLLRFVIVGLYLYTVFGILLPRIVDYSAILDAFAAAAPEALLVVFVIGVFGWVAEGLGYRELLPSLGVRRSTTTWLAQTAVGSTVPGPVKMAFTYALFRGWGILPGTSALVITLNGLATQAGKLILPAIAAVALTASGTLPATGFLLAVLIALPVVLGIMVGVWVLRSERFARRVGALAERATDAVMRRMRRPQPEDLADRLLDFRVSAKDMALSRGAQTGVAQLLARTTGFVLLTASMRAVGVPAEVLPSDWILAVYAAVMVITLIPIAPGGAGLPELLYISFFTNLVPDPAYADLIGAGVMLYRGMSWFLPIPVGYAALYLARRRERRRTAEPDPLGGPDAPDATA